MYVCNARCSISCVPCGHITDDIIVPNGYQYIHWFCARNVPFHLFDGGKLSLRVETKGQSYSEGPLEYGGRYEVHSKFLLSKILNLQVAICRGRLVFTTPLELPLLTSSSSR